MLNLADHLHKIEQSLFPVERPVFQDNWNTGQFLVCLSISNCSQVSNTGLINTMTKRNSSSGPLMAYFERSVCSRFARPTAFYELAPFLQEDWVRILITVWLGRVQTETQTKEGPTPCSWRFCLYRKCSYYFVQFLYNNQYSSFLL